MNTQQQKIGAFIADLRKQRGLTQGELAKQIHTSQSALARMERGSQNLSVDMLTKISQALNREIVSVGSGAMSFQIQGGHKLHGSVSMSASKNAAVGLLCASLLNKGTTTLKRVPRIEEVYRLVEVLESIGVHCKWLKDNDLRITPPEKLNFKALDAKAASRTRSIIMFMGPFMHLADTFSIPYVGGCKLGTRTVWPHLEGLKKLGLRVKVTNVAYEVTIDKRKPAEVILSEAGDTVTENVLMAAAKMDGVTVIKYASANYMVQDVCFFLQKLGVQVEGIGTSTLTVYGKPEINMDVEYAPSEDPIEAMSFLAAAIVTNSSITLKRCPIDFLELELLYLKNMGFKYAIKKEYLAENGQTRLVDIETKPSVLKALKDKIAPLPYPGINMDNLPFFVLVASKAKGRTLIHDWPYENRAIYYTELNKIGGKITLLDIHRAEVDGPVEFTAADVSTPPALRPSMLVLLGMLSANGTSMLRNVYSINRGYERIAEKLNKLGARVTIVN
ncbi:TPA: UDP-N-acetylglucosamine 1-carboxyvinyltransferase [Candidatus Uhrbacteria bacterium]|nr:UDP-N-acetylglucosamine 1-carboxyvinyltransferase [Candidatus Uhrbacteria bacterium]